MCTQRKQINVYQPAEDTEMGTKDSLLLALIKKKKDCEHTKETQEKER